MISPVSGLKAACDGSSASSSALSLSLNDPGSDIDDVIEILSSSSLLLLLLLEGNGSVAPVDDTAGDVALEDEEEADDDDGDGGDGGVAFDFWEELLEVDDLTDEETVSLASLTFLATTLGVCSLALIAAVSVEGQYRKKRNYSAFCAFALGA